jgi:sugar lactone lactonase YvrE
MKTTNIVITILLSLMAATVQISAETIRCAGILGNSGEQGASLVRFNNAGASGIGIAVDRYGSIWDRAGAGFLNRYTVDGRLLATYKIPGGAGNRNIDAIAVAGDDVILRLGGGLYTIAIDAPTGSEAKDMKIAADLMSLSSRDGWVIASKGNEIFQVNTAGEKKPVAIIDKAPDMGLTYNQDGKICVIRGWKVYRISPEEKDGLAAIGDAPGERPQFLNGYWYGNAWHSTLRRFDKELMPAPGVVLGGNSGSFIGHVDEQSEVVNGRGTALIRENLYAISGIDGIMHLLEWKPLEKRFAPVRRIGAVVSCNAIGLDRTGRIWYKSGNWNWNDGPDTPLRYGIPEPELFAAVMQSNDSILGYGLLWGNPAIMNGNFDKEVRNSRMDKQPYFPNSAIAIAISEYNKKRAMYILDKQGKLTALYINGNGEFAGEAGPTQLTTVTPVKEWTSLVYIGKDRMLGAADGYVIEFDRDGLTWKELRRWNSWGDAAKDKFGGKITISEDGGKLWISDTGRNRVLCFSTDKLLAEFGEMDKAGDDLTHLNAPKTITARGNRAVVFDSGNQRLVKLEINLSGN